MACLTLTDARNLMLKGRPWTFRMECTLNGRSAAWLATGRALFEPVEIHFGAIGAKPTILVKDWAYVEKTAPEKAAKGYAYVDTPFVRVQPSTIKGLTPPSPVVPMAPSPSPVVPMTTSPSPVVPMTTSPSPVVPMTTSTKVVPMVAPMVVSKLPGPWGLIAGLKPNGGQWIGVDTNGGTVMSMSKDAARRLVQDHGLPVVGL